LSPGHSQLSGRKAAIRVVARKQEAHRQSSKVDGFVCRINPATQNLLHHNLLFK
jgi:hypothetical protein